MILLLTRDLFFASKVTGTAQQLGLAIAQIDNVAALTDRIAAGDVTGIILDLGSGIAPVDIAAAASSGNPRPQLLAFGAHVDTAALDAARQAGFENVLPRSRFSATLPDLLTSLAATTRLRAASDSDVALGEPP